MQIFFHSTFSILGTIYSFYALLPELLPGPFWEVYRPLIAYYRIIGCCIMTEIDVFSGTESVVRNKKGRFLCCCSFVSLSSTPAVEIGFYASTRPACNSQHCTPRNNGIDLCFHRGCLHRCIFDYDRQKPCSPAAATPNLL